MNIYIDEAIINYCQNIGYSRNLIIQAWNECQGNEEILLDTLFYLSAQPPPPQIKRIPKNIRPFLKKLPRKHHVKLNFRDDSALEFLELRKLGLFSKKPFRNIKGLSLDYSSSYKTLKDKHISILANHLNGGLRKLDHLSIALKTAWSWHGETANMIPLLKSIKQSFVCLVSLKLAFCGGFGSSGWEYLSWRRLFTTIRPTLKHLDLNFGENVKVSDSFSEDMGLIIMNNLQKLETLCLHFNLTHVSTSAGVIRLLLNGACTHLTCLKSLDINVEGCFFGPNDWNSSHPNHNLTNNLQYLKLNINGCRGRFDDLWTLQDDIVILCPELKELFLSAENYRGLPNKHSSAFERGFLERLTLKRFRFLCSHDSQDLENNWNGYQEAQAYELKQTIRMEEEFENLKQRARGEEEIDLYYKTLMEEKQAPTKYEENEYLENHFENQFFEKEKIEEEAQDDLVQMAQEYGEVVFMENFSDYLEESNYLWGQEFADHFEMWEIEEEIQRDLEEI